MENKVCTCNRQPCVCGPDEPKKKRFTLKWREVSYAESYVSADSVEEALQKGRDFEDESYDTYDGSQSYTIVEVIDENGDSLWEEEV